MLKDHLRELVAVCRKSEEDMEAVKKVWDDAGTKPAKAKLAVDGFKAELTRLWARAQPPQATRVRCLWLESRCLRRPPREARLGPVGLSGRCARGERKGRRESALWRRLGLPGRLAPEAPKQSVTAASQGNNYFCTTF